MKTLNQFRNAAALGLLALAALAGCRNPNTPWQSSLFTNEVSFVNDEEWQESVAKDPFPTANRSVTKSVK